jgi:putative selenium metabolism hydrolase
MAWLSPSDQKALVNFLRELVQIPSPSGQEGALAQRLAEEMERLGFPEVKVDKVGNVIGKIGSGNRPIILFDGHMDTVEVADYSSWTRDPYGGEIDGRLLYGLGASDMKGGLASMVYGLAALIKAGAKIPGTVYFVGVVQEEPSEGTALKASLQEEGIMPDFAIIGEPSSLRIIQGHRGRMGIIVTTKGKACHASAPELGQNAIYAASRIIFGIELMSSQFLNDAYLGKGSAAVTWIRSESPSRNAVPPICSFYVDRRLTLGETEAKALAEIRSIVIREGANAEITVNEYEARSYTGYTWKVREYFPAWFIPQTHPLVQAGLRAAERVLGFRPHLGCWKFSTDGVYTMGEAGIPTIGFGPGDEQWAHSPDERIRIDDLFAAAEVYAEMVLEIMR